MPIVHLYIFICHILWEFCNTLFFLIEFLGNLIETILMNLTNIKNISLRDFGNISMHLDQVFFVIMKHKKQLRQIELFDFSNSYFEPS